MRASCSRRWSPARSMSGCVIGSWPRRAATRWRCSSCRAASTPAELAGGFGLSDDPGVVGADRAELQRAAGAAVARATRLLLLVAAAEPVGDPVLVWRAAAELGIGPDAAAPATAAGLVDFGAQVRFGHPLVRSASKAAAAPEERQRVHRALAEATDADVDPDRRAWHLAHATAGLDEDVAAELERSAGRARARGGIAAGAAFHERAVELTPDPRRRAQRALLAAKSKHQAGANDAALRLLAIAQARTAGRARAGPCPAVARAGHLRDDAGTRCSAAAARGGQAARAAGPDARARDLPRSVRGCPLGGPPGARRAMRARSRQPFWPPTGSPPRAPAICCSTGSPCSPARATSRRRPGVEGRAARVPGRAALRGGRAALALAGLPHRPRRLADDAGVGRADRAASRARAPRRRVLGAARRAHRPHGRRAVRRTVRRGHIAGRRGGRRRRGHRQPPRPAHLDHAGQLARTGRRSRWR